MQSAPPCHEFQGLVPMGGVAPEREKAARCLYDCAGNL